MKNIKMNRIIILLSFVCSIQLVNQTALAQTPANFSPATYQDADRNKRIATTFPIAEEMIKKYAEAHHFPGYAFGIVVDGNLVFKSSGGYANLEQKIPASSSSMFRIASMSKSFTALAILQLRDQGKLHLDDPVEMYIPAMKGQGLTKDAPVITIRHLMSHSAGFPEDNPWGDRQLADNEAELLKLIKAGISFSNAAGLEYEYSNLGFTMLGYIIHKVSGLTYDAYIKKNILAPIGMNETTYEFSNVPEKTLANGYRYINNNWRKETLLHDGIYGAMGGMITSIDMFSKYLALHQTAWPARNDGETFPVKRSSIREMHQSSKFISLMPNYTYPSGRVLAATNSYTYGLNWMRDALGRNSVGHSGGLPGFGSNWRFMPEYGIGVILFANVTYAPTSVINIAILDTIVQLAKLKPRVISVSPILQKRKVQLVSMLPNFTSSLPIFAENFFEDYPIETLKKEAAAILKEAGEIISVGEMVVENQMRGYCIIQCQQKKIKLAFTLTPENPGLIQEYHLDIVENSN
jgi:CubicO group peptidase (beta-lactamase class C family)